MDVAAAQEVFARRQRLGEEAINFAYTIKTRALTRLGELLRDMPKAEGTRGKGRPKLGGTQTEPPKHATTPTLADIGVTKKVAAVAQQLAALPARAWPTSGCTRAGCCRWPLPPVAALWRPSSAPPVRSPCHRSIAASRPPAMVLCRTAIARRRSFVSGFPRPTRRRRSTNYRH